MKLNTRLKNDLRQFLLEKIRHEKNKVTVVSGYEIGTEEKTILKNKFPVLDWRSAKFSVDKSIIAGVIITVGSKIIDLSIKGQLLNLYQTIYEID